MGTLIVKNVKHFLVFFIEIVLRGKNSLPPPPPAIRAPLLKKSHENSLWEIFEI